MSISTIHREDLIAADDETTASVDIVEAVFTPWDDDQAADLDALLAELNGLARLDRAVLGDHA